MARRTWADGNLFLQTYQGCLLATFPLPVIFITSLYRTKKKKRSFDILNIKYHLQAEQCILVKN